MPIHLHTVHDYFLCIIHIFHSLQKFKIHFCIYIKLYSIKSLNVFFAFPHFEPLFNSIIKLIFCKYSQIVLVNTYQNTKQRIFYIKLLLTIIRLFIYFLQIYICIYLSYTTCYYKILKFFKYYKDINFFPSF